MDKKTYEKLKKSDNSTKIQSYKDKIFYGKVVDVYDGDTIKVNILINDTIEKYNIRLDGYDAPEMRTKNNTEKEYAKVSRKMMEILVLDKIVKLECKEYDKYGRLLADIYVKNNDKEMNINKFMIDKKYGYSYNGKKKDEFDEKNFNKNIEDIETNEYSY